MQLKMQLFFFLWQKEFIILYGGHWSPLSTHAKNFQPAHAHTVGIYDHKKCLKFAGRI